MVKISDTIRVVPGYRRDIPKRHVPINTLRFALAQTVEIPRGLPIYEGIEDLSTLEDQASDPVTDAEAENDPEYEQWCEGFRV